MDNAITIDEIIDFIASKFSPATDLADSDCTFTTDQILIQLFAHFGDLPYSKEQIVNGLKLSGFKYDCPDGQLNFVWVFKEKI